MNFSEHFKTAGLLLFASFSYFPSLLASTQPPSAHNTINQSNAQKQLVSRQDIAQQTKQELHTSFFSQLAQLSPQQNHHNSTKLYQYIQQSTNLTLTVKEFYLFELAKALKNIPTNESKKILTLISQEVPQVITLLEDAGHQQQITAFPFNYAALASLNQLAITQLSQTILTLVIEADYPAIGMQTAFLSEQRKQLEVLRYIVDNISQQQAEMLLSWALNHSKIHTEAKFIVAIKAQKKKTILNLLEHSNNIPLHHYLAKIITLWPQQEQLAAIKNISVNKRYASQANYYVDHLAISSEQKIQFWFQQLNHRNSGASAAHMLAQNMTPDIADQLVSYINNSSAIANKSASNQIQQRAVLALSLSQHDYAQSQLKQLINQRSLTDNIHKEISQW